MWPRILYQEGEGSSEGGGAAPAGAEASVTPGGDVSRGAAPDWRSGLSEELRADTAIAGMDGVATLAKSYVEARSKVSSENSVVIPGNTATQQERNAFYERLGRPDSFEKYELPTEGMPATFKADESRVTLMKQKAFEVGITRDQFAALVRADAEYAHGRSLESSAQTAATQHEWEQKLRESMGTAFEQDIGLAKAAVQQFGGDELRDVLNETGLGNHPAVVTAFAAVGRAIQSDEVLGRGRGATIIPNRKQAEDELIALQADGDFMKSLEQKYHPSHEANLAKWQALHSQAAPQEVASP